MTARTTSLHRAKAPESRYWLEMGSGEPLSRLLWTQPGHERVTKRIISP
jgi:hypothetical protein